MIIKKNLSLKDIIRFSGQHFIWLVPWMTLVTILHYYTNWHWLGIPWLPLSLIGVAVAFYLGFKNNQAYGRFWEARIIWGGLVNDSRKFATLIKNYSTSVENSATNTVPAERRELILRHIGYLYQLRDQLLKPTSWEHIRLRGIYGYFNQKRSNNLVKHFSKELEEIRSTNYISTAEKEVLEKFSNRATQILDMQTREVQNLFVSGKINMMQQAEIQNIIQNFYDEQGKAERLKNTPFPRKFASHAFIFTCIFIFLLPFGIVSEFAKSGDGMIWLSIPVGTVVGWIYVVMELVGDYSENPFESLRDDVPMLAICRNIEIDLLQMIGESKIPKPIQVHNDVLW